MTDTISDFLTRVRNAIKANHRIVEIPSSNLKKEITKILFDKGYILNYKFEETENKQGLIKIALKYHPVTKQSAIRSLDRISSPGLRQYTGISEMPKVANGLGIAILSTSRGVMTDKEARKQNVGGEVICFVS
jgi:small subunit ribosomal protein S8